MKRNWLLAVLLACAAASLFHHAHNAEFLDQYPNMPAWLSAPLVYAAWVIATAIGFIGYLTFRAGHRQLGLGLMVIYGFYGLDVFAHYALAPLAAHSAAMNASIWLEAVTAALLLLFLALRSRKK